MTNPQQQWCVPPLDLRLPEKAVHVWRASLNAPLSVIQHLHQFLAEEEVTRAKRFLREADRNHFIVARGTLRVLLSRYLKTEPDQLRFCYNAYGKPALASNTLSFNLSHSHEIALYAFTYVGHIGIDIEYMRYGIEYEQLAKHSFSPYEQSILHALPEAAKHQAFFTCWTRKEAYIKARGKGFSLAPDLFDVSLDEPAMLLHSREDAQEPIRWSLQDLAPIPGYASALAVEGKGRQLSYWQV